MHLRGPRTAHAFATIAMDTAINIQVVGDQPRESIEPAVNRAFAWFETVERICTRFDRSSEVMQLLDQVGSPAKISTLLSEVLAFALDLAEQTDGAFDPTIGAVMEQLGFNTHYKTGAIIRTGEVTAEAENASYRDVTLDRRAHRVLLRKPLILDLNAVSKGLALDLAARELADFEGACIEAGGDIVVSGHNLAGEVWHIGIQHPRAAGLLAQTLHLTDTAVCTSGDYERRVHVGEGDQSSGHILDPRTHRAVADLASVTVVAPTAMAADGLSTAAMVLGRKDGLRFLEEQGVGGLLIAADGSSWQVNL